MNIQHPDRRSERRVPLNMPATLLCGSVRAPVRVFDLSYSGARVTFDPNAFDPAAHHVESLQIWDQRLDARVVWSLYAGMIGLSFRETPETSSTLAALLAE